MIKIQIKPLSVNSVWQGRRFKTEAYKNYEKELFFLLPKIKIPDKEKLTLILKIGFSNKNSDIDNSIKPFVDILQKKYGFNDKKIYKLEITKKDIKKGEEYIMFNISKYND